MFRLLHWRTAFMYAAMILIATFGSTVYITTQVRRVRLADLEAQLLSETRLLATSATPLLQDGSTPRALDEMARLWAAALAGRVTIIGAEGSTLGESHEDRTEMENHLLRPEVQQALMAGQGSSIRFSNTLGYDMMYAAVPVRTGGGQLLGIIRIALPMEEIEKQLSDLRRNVMLIGSMTAMLAALLALLLAEKMARPVRQLFGLTEKIKKGDLRAALISSPSDEAGLLINTIAQAFEQTYTRVTILSSVLDHVADGVLITDENGKINLINATAARMIGVDQDVALGSSFIEVVSIQPLIDIWRKCGERSAVQETKVEFDDNGANLQAIVTPFVKAGIAECLVILQDLTGSRRLETSRSNMIANMSRELRVPLARLRAFVETLNSEGGNIFTAVVEYENHLVAEVDNLNNIADELLQISHLGSGTVSMILAPVPVADVVIPLVEQSRPQARLAGLEFNFSMPPEMPQIMADVDRARLVLRNLLHNAIKFTPPGGCIKLVVQPAGQEILFSVQDSGVGISAEDLPHIFDKSFQGDWAQNGAMGRGLVIAKQIVIGHGGRIWAESIEDQGSTFYFTLPVLFLETTQN